MTFCLDAKIIKPVGENINNAVILLHGYGGDGNDIAACLLYTSPSPRDLMRSRMPSSA